ncbi:CoA transferase [Rhodobacter sp. HX-7-19]|uniref:CoA transferase n=1 Tax=Paragemmobacter kunshanensis TaxID=2583234 RepID=A0A6M1U889_9RHOB|nr:CaiB/BaiF CoA-transferase family protein [Rhodobacter kunshanensis]NGQ91393.1 CoA transferase [Rhodobacter kunshanensis]
MARDLEGLLVVALEQAVAAPLCTARLADAGARVIKVERPGGDFARGYDRLVHGESAYFVWANRGKESICLDLRVAEDLALLKRMVAQADVFVQNLAPGAAERLGLGAEAVRAGNPGLIHLSISGYGDEGPYREQKAYDMLIQGESGLLSINGTPEGAARVGISVCDIAAGETAFAAVLQSLLARGIRGEGRAVEVSLFHTMADWMNVPYLQAAYGGATPPRVGLRHPSIAPYGAFDCADGRQVLLAVQSDREWAMLAARVLGQAELADDPRFATNVARVAHREAVEALIAPVLAGIDREAAMARLGAAGIACGRLSGMEDLAVHPQARRITVESPTGPVAMMARGVRFSDGEAGAGAVPALDQHGAVLRAEFGQGG